MTARTFPRLARWMATVAVAATASIAFAQNAAIVNNKPIPKERVDEFVAALAAQGRPDTPELRAMVRDELIARELFVQEAEKLGLARQTDVARALDNARQEILIRAVIRDFVKKNPVTDAEIQAEYDRVRKQAGDKEYRARHILVDKEEDAKRIIDQLKKGAKFEELAKQSKDTGSAANGGDLDWNVPGTFVKPFSDAMVKLEKGRVTDAPVQTQFGWHVIRLDDVRDMKAPPVDQLKPQLQQTLEQRKVQELQKRLRASAKIQ